MSGTCLGPLSSSHEKDDAEPHYRNYCRTAFKPPPAFMVRSHTQLLGSYLLLLVLTNNPHPLVHPLVHTLSFVRC